MTQQHWHQLATHTPLGILTDLDGTLIPFADTPDQARPTPDLVATLTELSGLPGVSVVVVSGRLRDRLDQFFPPETGLWLIAEHGAWRRASGAWQSLLDIDPAAVMQLADRLERLIPIHKGSLLERKSFSVALHYRQVRTVEREELKIEADSIISEWLTKNPGFQRLDGVQVIEVRPIRQNKSVAVPWLRDRLGPQTRIVALGDDLTDEDMFEALGVADDAVQVGEESSRQTHARWRLESPSDALRLLRWIVDARKDVPTPTPAVLPMPIRVSTRTPRVGSATIQLLVISNRLPDLRTPTKLGEDRKRNVGGLVSALEPAMASRNGLWLGWSGQLLLGAKQPPPAKIDTGVRPALAWVDFPEDWHKLYYNGFANQSLWPLFHTFPGRVRFNNAEWEAYVHANEAFAKAAAEIVGPETPIWVHDYHLLLVASFLRRGGHRGPIGLFLHIPFPCADVFAMLPWAEQILDGMLDYDLLGFHTPWYVENFRATVGKLSPGQVGDEVILHRGRRCRVRAFPIGIVPESFQETPDPSMGEEISGLLRAIAPSRLILGVDRLDYTKGIPERLNAFGRLLELFKDWRGRVSLVQVSVPSRADVPEYAEQRARIENAVGRINGEFGEANWVPVRYLYRSYTRNPLSQLYRAADVGYVTPLRDGMNLVAKEYVAAQDPANPGVLVLSQFAGAAAELREAVLTNPWHADGMAQDLDRALKMPLEERVSRHAKLLAVINRTTALTWAEDFLAALDACAPHP